MRDLTTVWADDGPLAVFEAIRAAEEPEDAVAATIEQWLHARSLVVDEQLWEWIVVDADEVMALYHFGGALWDLSLHDEAVAVQHVAKERGSIPAAFALGVWLDWLEADGAEAALRDFVANHPDWEDIDRIWGILGSLIADFSGDDDNASAREAETMLQRVRGQDEVWDRWLARVLARRGAYNEALELLAPQVEAQLENAVLLADDIRTRL